MNVSESNSSSCEYIKRKNDPVYLLSLINKYVKVELILDISFSGFVNSVDPVTHSIILLVPKQDIFQTTLIPGEAVLEVDELPPPAIRPPQKKEGTLESEKYLNEKKNKLMAWFKWNLLPVSEFKDKIIVQSVHVLPPYKVSNIYAENPVIALQIRKIMERMPHDFKSE